MKLAIPHLSPRVIKILLVVFAIKMVILTGFVLYPSFYKQSAKSPTVAGVSTKSDANALIEQVGKVLVLPTDEKPTIATISDKTKLAKDSFFQKAENGDKLILYGRAHMAIVYRPGNGKIVNVAQIEQSVDGKPSQTASFSSALVNPQ